MTAEKRLKVQVWVLILVVFVLGSATGASIHALYNQRQVRMNATRLAPGSSPLLDRMRQELELTDQQDDQLQAILLSARKEMGQQKLSQCPGVKEVRDRTDIRIRAVLTPEQQEKFTEIRAKRDAERAADANKPAN
jgi:Spy/CpxP family protein refolding chaperone